MPEIRALFALFTRHEAPSVAQTPPRQSKRLSCAAASFQSEVIKGRAQRCFRFKPLSKRRRLFTPGQWNFNSLCAEGEMLIMKFLYDEG